jgi:hypothetical protein
MGQSRQSNQSEGRSDTRDGQQLTLSGAHQGDLTPSSFVSGSRSGGFLHTHSCGLAPSRPYFLARDYLRKTLETTWPRFDWGGEGIGPYLILWRGACPGWLSPPNGETSSTQILTRHYDAKSRLLASSRTRGPRCNTLFFIKK